MSMYKNNAILLETSLLLLSFYCIYRGNVGAPETINDVNRYVII
jgi:hypothetical protein